MSLSSVEKSSAGRVASRRNVVRGAAWSGAAVTIVVATPNIAAATHHEPQPGTKPINGVAGGTVTRAAGSGDRSKPVTFDITFEHTGTTSFQLSVSLLSSSGTTQTLTRQGTVNPGNKVRWPIATSLSSADPSQTLTLEYYAITPDGRTTKIGSLVFTAVTAGSTRTGTWTAATT